jgi:hypothetical protein
MSLDKFTSAKKEFDQQEPMDFGSGLIDALKFWREQHQLATREEATSSFIQRYAFVKDDPMDSLYNS